MTTIEFALSVLASFIGSALLVKITNIIKANDRLARGGH